MVAVHTASVKTRRPGIRPPRQPPVRPADACPSVPAFLMSEYCDRVSASRLASPPGASRSSAQPPLSPRQGSDRGEHAFVRVIATTGPAQLNQRADAAARGLSAGTNTRQELGRGQAARASVRAVSPRTGPRASPSKSRRSHRPSRSWPGPCGLAGYQGPDIQAIVDHSGGVHQRGDPLHLARRSRKVGYTPRVSRAASCGLASMSAGAGQLSACT